MKRFWQRAGKRGLELLLRRKEIAEAPHPVPHRVGEPSKGAGELGPAATRRDG